MSFLNKMVLLAVILSLSGLAAAQNNTGSVSGTIVADATGDALIGVSVVVEGTNQGTITDFNGRFSLQAVNGQTLRISYIGYKTQEVVISSPRMEIRMVEDTEALDEIIVVGYGVQKK